MQESQVLFVLWRLPVPSVSANGAAVKKINLILFPCSACEYLCTPVHSDHLFCSLVDTATIMAESTMCYNE